MNLFFSLRRITTGIRGWLALFFVFDVVYWLFLLVRPFDHEQFLFVADIFALVGPLLGALLCLYCLHRLYLRSSLFITLAALSHVLGTIFWCYYELVLHQPPFPSVGTFAYAAVYPLFLCGILSLPAHKLSTVSWTRMILDGLMMFSALFTFSWYFVLGPILLQSHASMLGRVLGTASPCGDLVLLFCILLLWTRLEDSRTRSAVLLLFAGLGCIVLADSSLDFVNLHGGYQSGSSFDPLWAIGYHCIALGVFALNRLPGRVSSEAPVAVRPLWQSLLPYAFVPALGLLLIFTWLVPSDSALQLGVYIGAFVVVGLVFVRQLVAMRELHALYANNDLLTSANVHLAVQATHDALTGLPNRTLLETRIDEVVQAAQEQGLSVALLLLDLDRFKEVNDTLGHHIGDLLLQQVGPRLQAALRSDDLIARLGGDEFAILLPAVTLTEVTHIAQAVLAALDEPFLVEGHALDIGGSMGIALAPEHGLDATTLLRCVDVAMYVAKRSHNSPNFYTPQNDQYSPERLALLSELRQTIADDGLVLYYQPKVSLSLGRIVGVEALVRWPHPTRGLIPPDTFIPLAEQTSLIGPLTCRVLEHALRQCAEWERAGLHLHMAVNLSVRTLHDPDLLSMISELLEKYQVAPTNLTLEITESMLMDDPELARTVLASLRNMGIHIALDDFGTGYSSLGYFKKLPLTEVKIDKTFVLNLGKETNVADEAIVQAVVAMARPFGCTVVAEGVERAEAWELLQKYGCDLAQGYYLSRPLPAPDLERWARTTPWRVPEQDVATIS